MDFYVKEIPCFECAEKKLMLISSACQVSLQGTRENEQTIAYPFSKGTASFERLQREKEENVKGKQTDYGVKYLCLGQKYTVFARKID